MEVGGAFAHKRERLHIGCRCLLYRGQQGKFVFIHRMAAQKLGLLVGMVEDYLHQEQAFFIGVFSDFEKQAVGIIELGAVIPIVHFFYVRTFEIALLQIGDRLFELRFDCVVVEVFVLVGFQFLNFCFDMLKSRQPEANCRQPIKIKSPETSSTSPFQTQSRANRCRAKAH